MTNSEWARKLASELETSQKEGEKELKKQEEERMRRSKLWDNKYKELRDIFRNKCEELNSAGVKVNFQDNSEQADKIKLQYRDDKPVLLFKIETDDNKTVEFWKSIDIKFTDKKYIQPIINIISIHKLRSPVEIPIMVFILGDRENQFKYYRTESSFFGKGFKDNLSLDKLAELLLESWIK